MSIKEEKRERGKEGKRERGKEGKRERGKEGKMVNSVCDSGRLVVF